MKKLLYAIISGIQINPQNVMADIVKIVAIDIMGLNLMISKILNHGYASNVHPFVYVLHVGDQEMKKMIQKRKEIKKIYKHPHPKKINQIQNQSPQ